VNPTVQGTILGETVYPDLLSLPLKPDVVDVFRRPEDIGPVVAQAIQIKAPVFWMQLGISNEPEAEKGRKAGMTVIQDRCMMSEWKRRWGD
jgi:predicted CoA-binding protein